MELRQLRYFVRVVELGSMGRAARELGLVPSALSQQISRLEGELATRLLQRTATGVIPTDAGLAFWRQAQMALRHADNAAVAAREARLSGAVSVGFAPSTASLLARPFVAAMQERYPDVRLHLVESLSGHLAGMLNARLLDLAVLFQTESGRHWSVMPLLDEKLFVVARPGVVAGRQPLEPMNVTEAARLPLAMPSKNHGLRILVDAAFDRAGVDPGITLEIDGLTTLMDIVLAHPIATIQPGVAVGRLHDALCLYPLDAPYLHRRNVVTSVSDDELSPPALAARVVLADLMRSLVREGHWPGATIFES
ncbi:LysR family transcriptional regulator [Pigmentiphaga sp. NML080357]|uniref:LysR family transcriptional regulator n=1 Tax=Pigmentiphaga sp. NML080357 TaxID=2008675 RepID=UPI000B41649F|nr:LysR family transcriptional regulator [Pigmentiphaga sp. NML080357]OVZ56900.1 LysR family transcriptional regulator [Pigmentiphaga sp. NML080357]